MNKGVISISKVTVCGGERGEDYMRIAVEDQSSHIQFLEIEMNLLDFALALTGSGCMPIEFELRGLDNIGKQFEHKTVEVSFERTLHFNKENIDKAVSEHEIDGWVGDRKDCSNNHNRVRLTKDSEIYRVCYWRYVEVEEEQNGKVA